jgi:dihydropteroate synthase
VPVSVDTYKSKVAEANLAAGAHLLNDIWGLKADDKMAGVIAKYDAACCLMHNRNEADYKNFMEDMKNDLRETLRLAKEAGIREDGIMTDPGVGFGKTYENNLEAIRCVGELNELGYPVLLGTSRKSVIGLTLDVPAKERDTATAVTSAYAVWAHCGFVRVHNVRANAEAIKMAEAIRDGGLHG